MTEQPPQIEIDLSQPAIAAEYMKICRGVLGNLGTAEPVKRFLGEVAERFEPTHPELAQYLERQIERIGSGDEVRHSVREGVPPHIQVRGQVCERLRLEEDTLRVQAADPRLRHRAMLFLMIMGFSICALVGLAIWGVVWLLGVESPTGEIIGLVAAVVLFAVYVRAVQQLIPVRRVAAVADPSDSEGNP